MSGIAQRPVRRQGLRKCVFNTLGVHFEQGGFYPYLHLALIGIVQVLHLYLHLALIGIVQVYPYLHLALMGIVSPQPDMKG